MTRPAEEFYESAPVGYVSTRMDGTIIKINRTLLDWIGRDRAEVLDRLRFADLLTVGGKLYHETHFAPLLHMQGRVDGIAMEVLAAGRRPHPGAGHGGRHESPERRGRRERGGRRGGRERGGR